MSAGSALWSPSSRRSAGAAQATQVTAPVTRPLPHADRRCLARLCLLLLALYLHTMAGRLTSGDGEAMYLTTKSLLTRAQLSIEPRPETATGRGGRSYSKYGLGQSLAQAPFFATGYQLGNLFGAADDRPARFAVGMTNSFVTVALVAVFWSLLRALACPRPAATAAALAFGVATLLWPYARTDFSEPLQATSVLLAFYALVRWRRAPALRWACVAGTAAGFAVVTKAAAAILLPPLALYFAVAFWERYVGALAPGRSPLAALRASAPEAVKTVAAAALPFGAFALFQAALNFYRFGSVTEFGYGNEPATGFTTPLLDGVRYLLFSSGKGLVFFSAPAVVGLVALLALLAYGRRHRLEAGVAVLVFAVELVYYARWWAWHGDWCWGPRYLYVTVPFVMLGWGPLFARWRTLRLSVRAASLLVVAAGVVVSFLGVAIDYGAYYSVVSFQVGRGADVVEARLVPEFSPLGGHLWLFKASAYGLAAGLGSGKPERSSADNPYRRAYPWAARYPDVWPEAPERAFGYAFWFAAIRDRTPFLEYWSALIAWWLAVALIPLGRRVWLSAGEREPSIAAESRSGMPAELESVPI
ncbi:MAG: hypothetical protein HY332_06755 [Chloroflexi bacterium]|nr:hypothetical protein [Chloroflexota bacterium]